MKKINRCKRWTYPTHQPYMDTSSYSNRLYKRRTMDRTRQLPTSSSLNPFAFDELDAFYRDHVEVKFNFTHGGRLDNADNTDNTEPHHVILFEQHVELNDENKDDFFDCLRNEHSQYRLMNYGFKILYSIIINHDDRRVYSTFIPTRLLRNSDSFIYILTMRSGEPPNVSDITSMLIKKLEQQESLETSHSHKETLNDKLSNIVDNNIRLLSLLNLENKGEPIHENDNENPKHSEEECSICRDENATEYLICLHTLCKTCHQEIIIKRKKPCPFCRTPQNDVEK